MWNVEESHDEFNIANKCLVSYIKFPSHGFSMNCAVTRFVPILDCTWERLLNRGRLFVHFEFFVTERLDAIDKT